MEKQDKTTNIQETVQEEELDELDASLMEIELFCKSRCVSPTGGNNVTVRKIESSSESK